MGEAQLAHYLIETSPYFVIVPTTHYVDNFCRVATVRGKNWENDSFSRSGKIQRILWMVGKFRKDLESQGMAMAVFKKGRVSLRGFSWYLNMSIIFWEQIATYRGHASPKTLNQLEL